jgi:hypothetical protein
VKSASTDVSEFSVNRHVPVPEHAPAHPPNVEPVLGVTANDTGVPVGKAAAHVGLQLMPDGVDTTVPVPVPAGLIVSVEVLLPVAATVSTIATVALPFDEAASATVTVPVYKPAARPFDLAVTVQAAESPEMTGTNGPLSPNQVTSCETE